MNRRLRVLGALLALLAFSAYFAEGVRAAACMPGMDDHGAEHASVDAHAGMNHGSSGDTDEAPDSPRCPLGMAGTGSCVAVSLPAFVDDQGPAFESSTVLLAERDDILDSLSTAGHFRPPRA
jgi:hypothetical protein